MTLQPLLLQLARMLGREVVHAALGDDPATVAALAAPARAALGALVRERRGEFVAALAAEAADSDDVADAASALAYGRSRIEEFAAVLESELRATLAAEYAARVGSWV